MAEQRISNERKRELEQIDPFQEKLIKAAAFAKENSKPIMLIAGAVVLVVVIFSSVMYSFEKAENEASVMVSEAMIKYRDAGDPEKGFEAVEKDFQAVFTEYSNTAAGKLARIDYAKICYMASKFDTSYQYYKEALDIFKKKASMENFILASLGHVCLARKDLKEAGSYFERIESGDSDLLKDEAIYMLAVLDESGNNKKESRERFEKIAREYGSSLYGPIARGRIGMIE